jgi:hypothetical protein
VKCTEKNGDKCGTKTSIPGLTALILPPDAFVTDAVVKEGTCNADLCVAGPALNATTCQANQDKQACVDLNQAVGIRERLEDLLQQALALVPRHFMASRLRRSRLPGTQHQSGTALTGCHRGNRAIKLTPSVAPRALKRRNCTSDPRLRVP